MIMPEAAGCIRGDGLLSVEKGGEIWYYIYDGHGVCLLCECHLAI